MASSKGSPGQGRVGESQRSRLQLKLTWQKIWDNPSSVVNTHYLLLKYQFPIFLILNGWMDGWIFIWNYSFSLHLIHSSWLSTWPGFSQSKPHIPYLRLHPTPPPPLSPYPQWFIQGWTHGPCRAKKTEWDFSQISGKRVGVLSYWVWLDMKLELLCQLRKKTCLKTELIHKIDWETERNLVLVKFLKPDEASAEVSLLLEIVIAWANNPFHITSGGVLIMM